MRREGNHEIPAEVREFLKGNIESYEQLEILLLLRGHSDQRWTPESVGEKLKLPNPAAAEALDQLGRRNLLDVGVGLSFRYAPGNPNVAALVEGFVQAYDANRLGIMNLMNTNAIDRVRTGAMHLFADAFILGRKRDKNG
ncbi:MAG: hypothetical protein SGI86_12255 [Deltaproteobacteria bacterium]|nr:hypothetical protein [Deltaproteobacteria bacterium]